MWQSMSRSHNGYFDFDRQLFSSRSKRRPKIHSKRISFSHRSFTQPRCSNWSNSASLFPSPFDSKSFKYYPLILIIKQTRAPLFFSIYQHFARCRTLSLQPTSRERRGIARWANDMTRMALGRRKGISSSYRFCPSNTRFLLGPPTLPVDLR